jgi:hypothetical protein
LLTSFFSFCPTGCRCSQEQAGGANVGNRKIDEDGRARKRPEPGPGQFAEPAELAAHIAKSIEALDYDGLLNIIDVSASLRMEAYRTLALAEGTWKPSRPDISLFEELTPATTAEQVESASSLLDDEDERKELQQRRRLLARVVRTLLAKVGPPSQCRPQVGKPRQAIRLLGRKEWSVPAKRMGGKLLEPWDRAVPMAVVCKRSRWKLLALREKKSGAWVLAEPAADLFRRHSWRYERLPEPDPFAASASRGKGRPDIKKLLAATIACFSGKNAECGPPLIDVRGFAARELAEAPFGATGPRQEQLDRLVATGASSLEMILPSVRLMIWRRLLMWVERLDLDWSKCEVLTVGVNELGHMKRRYEAAWSKRGLPEPVEEMLRRFGAIRSIVAKCPKRVRLTVTGARDTKSGRWKIIDLVVEQWPGSPGRPG